jgi:hypothetical protein
VRAKAVVARAPCAARAATGVFETAVHAAGRVTLSW